MSAVLEKIDHQVTRNLVPLNTLPDEEFEKLLEAADVQNFPPGELIFSAGETESINYYLLEGKVELLTADRAVDVIVAGTNTTRFPIAHQFPRRYSAKTKTAAKVLKLESHLLGELLEKSSKQSYQVADLDSDSGQSDWMVKLLHSRIFQAIPADSLQQIIARMEVLSVKKGQEVIRQGDEGDYYYVIDQGYCAVLHQDNDGPVVELARLESGDCFGEEALLSGSPRSSTVTMLSDGLLHRLSKANFDEFIKRPLSQDINYTTAVKQVEEGAVWLDIREPEQYLHGHLSNALNLPFASLRYQATSLAPDRDYIVYCENGSLSITAAYLLVDRGLNVVVLRNGWQAIPEDEKQQLLEDPGFATLADVPNKDSSQTDEQRIEQLEADAKRSKLDNQRELDSVSQALKDKEARLLALKEQYKQTTNSEQKLQEELSKLDHLNGELQRQLNSSGEQLNAEQRRNENFRVELEQARKAEAGNRKNTLKLREELQRLTNEIDDRDNEILRLQSQYSQIEVEKADAIAALDKEQLIAEAAPKNSAQALKAGAQLLEADERITRMRKERDRDINVLTDRISKLEQQLTDSGRAFSDASARFDGLEENYKSRIVDLEKELRNANQQAARLGDVSIQRQMEQQLADYRSKIDLFESERDEAREQLTASIEESRELRQLVEEYVENAPVVQHSQEEFEALEQELELVREQAEAEIAQAKAVSNETIDTDAIQEHDAVEVELLRQEFITLEKSLKERENALQESVSDRQMMEDELEDRDRELDKLRQRLEYLEVEHDEASYQKQEAEEARVQVEEALYKFQEDIEEEKTVDLRDERLRSSITSIDIRDVANGGFLKGLVSGLVMTLMILGGVAWYFGGMTIPENWKQAISLPESTDEVVDDALPPEVKMPIQVEQGERVIETLEDSKQAIVLRKLPAGELWVDENKYLIDGFLVGETEVQMGIYQVFVEETGAQLPQNFGWDGGGFPVVGVSWQDAQAFVDWLSKKTGHRYRLLTSNEWEYAARAGTLDRFWWGEALLERQENCLDCGADEDGAQPSKSASYEANPFGIYDMLGNVAEWVQNCAKDDADCTRRVYRGGAFNKSSEAMDVTKKEERAVDFRQPFLGFRVAREL